MSTANGRRRVVITGLGGITPCGNTMDETWEGIRSGRSGVSRIERVRGAGGHAEHRRPGEGLRPARVHGPEVRPEDRPLRPARVWPRRPRPSRDADLDIAADAARIGCSIGTGIGGLRTQEVAYAKLFDAGPDRLNPFWVTALISNMGAAETSMALGTRGPLTTETTACAASGMSLGNATMYIRAGMADAMLAGGVESPITLLALGGFGTMRALSRRLDDPEGASRPFDLGRDGFILSEGSTVLVLEELERARRRDARIYAEVLGYGMSSDSHHVTEPDPVGTNPARAITMAMDDAGVTPDDVGYVNAHGTSTPAGDSAETRALKIALGEERARVIPISSTKSETGHLLGATGAVEAAVTVLAMRDGFLPPTINLTDPDPDCDLDYIPNTGREADVRVAISNSFGFGGHNAVLVLGRWDQDSD